MKKIALLLTIVCAGRLYGMEAENIGSLPKELHDQLIQMAFTTSNNPAETIKAIQFASAVHGVQYDNLKDFTRLVHLLADKFDTRTDIIANEFRTPAAKTYSTLGYSLIKALGDNTPVGHAKVADLIQQGADVNFISGDMPLYKAMRNLNVEGVKLLLNAGANPTFAKNWFFMPTLFDQPEEKEDAEKESNHQGDA